MLKLCTINVIVPEPFNTQFQSLGRVVYHENDPKESLIFILCQVHTVYYMFILIIHVIVLAVSENVHITLMHITGRTMVGTVIILMSLYIIIKL